MGYQTKKIIQLKDAIKQYGDYFIDEDELKRLLMKPSFYIAKTAIEKVSERNAAERRRKRIVKELSENIRNKYY